MLFCTLDIINVIPILILLVYLFTVVCRWLIFKKMHVRPWLSLIPVVREYMIFKRCWKVWPYILLLALALVFGLFVQITSYMDIYMPIPPFIKTNMRMLSVICLVTINILKCKRLAFAFGHDIVYLMGLLFLSPIFLGMLAFSKKSIYREARAKRKGKELKRYLQMNRTPLNRVLSAVSAVVIVVCSVAYVGDLMMSEQQPGFLVQKKLSDIYDDTAGLVSGRGQVIYPALNESTPVTEPVRDLYFPDKSKMTDTTVYMYLIGSTLENNTGSASINLAQIKDATAAGSNLKFIVEAGGTYRWFTDGIKNRKTARYLIQNGEVSLIETLPNNTCMAESETLEDFLKWANENYQSDRRMLFFWDHGGALSGFGKDVLNMKPDNKLMSMKEIVQALKASNAKYDVIAFDACFMQTMEVGQCLEPYADYLLASEESEPTSGMYYTAAFSRLAKEPALNTLIFGAMMCSSYDQSLEMINRIPQAGATMSMIDLRYMPLVSKTFVGYLQKLDSKFKTDRTSFINMSTARSKAYEFQMEDQIDLIDFINQSDLTAAEKKNMIGKINNSIAVRNAASANHINGLAVYMPYDNLNSYSNMYNAMRTLDMNQEAKVYSDFASILGSQKVTKGKDNYENYSLEKWYVKGFDHYNSSLYMQDIPLIKKGHEYKIQLSDKQWDTITNYEQGLKLKVGKRYADLGSDNVFDLDDKGHYMLEFNDTWVAINDVLVALHPGTPKDMGDGTIVYSGTVDAMLNFITPITIYIEWVDVGDLEGEGKVLGYLPADEDSDDFDEAGMPRGYKQFKSNNFITFLYDWYDEDDNYLSTAAGHMPIFVGTYGLKVTQKDISSEEYIYYGILQDVMHRTIHTETLHHKPH